MSIKPFLAAAFFFLAAVSAPAQQPDTQECSQEDKKWCNLKSKLGQLPNLSRFLQGDEEKAKKFANAAYDSPSSQEGEWKAFDMLLGGGKLDSGGSLISAELKKLPPEQWYYIIRLEDRRRGLVQLGGSWYGNFTEGLGNLIRPKDAEMHVMKCNEQGENLMAQMDTVDRSGRPQGVFSGWKHQLLTAKFRKMSEHNAPCFDFQGPEGPVEIVADSWGDALVPARVWWQRYDPKVPSAMGGNEVCGKTYDRWHGDRAYQANDPRGYEESQAQRLQIEANLKAAQERARKRFQQNFQGNSQ